MTLSWLTICPSLLPAGSAALGRRRLSRVGVGQLPAPAFPSEMRPNLFAFKYNHA